MAAFPLEKEIYYPESDGEPMAESELHLEEMVYVWEGLKQRFEAEPDVFVGADLFLYYRKGDPKAVVAPDGFVVKGVPKWPAAGGRKTYLLWEEGQAPCFVLETTSESTRWKDEEKKEIYGQLGVDEYFQFDPCGEYLKPRLQGVRLVGRRYRPVEPEPDGSLLSRSTGVLFRAEGDRLRLTVAATGEPLLRKEEETAARRQAEEKTAAERKARRQAEQRVTAEMKARRQADEARRQAEQRAAAEVTARQQAEERIRAFEEELARLRRPAAPG
jgi:Uma2 family endonuclease